VTYLAFLRAINLAGQRKVAMADLRDLVTNAGFQNPRTLLQSGNVLFESEGRATAADVETRLAAASASRLGFPVEFFVRTQRQLELVIARNPFPGEAKRDPSHLLVLFLREPPLAADVRALRAAIPGRERVEAGGSHLYLVYPDGIGRSRLTNALIERTIRGRGTARNWNTVLKLSALAGT
jgi:uncharacterized protein (DUF1697 family)